MQPPNVERKAGGGSLPRRVPHQLALKNRERLAVEGVTNVENFDHQEILLEIVGGTLLIKGENLQIRELNVEAATLTVEGRIDSLEYGGETVTSKGKGFISRLFR